MSREFNGWNEIDWDIDIDSVRFQFHIIEAWNKNNPNVKGKWTKWPNELGDLKLILRIRHHQKLLHIRDQGYPFFLLTQLLYFLHLAF